MLYAPDAGRLPAGALFVALWSRCRPAAVSAVLFLLLFAPATAHATLFAEVSGVVHDRQHRPLQGAEVELRAEGSAYAVRTRTKPDGSFRFAAVPFGEYVLLGRDEGFSTVAQRVTVTSGSSPVLHVELPLLAVHQSVTVTAEAWGTPGFMTPTVLLGQTAIEDTPGADRSGSLAMITDHVPGAYITHDMLHMRGGHQVSWLMDGVEIPNTNIASNLGPQVDPRDIQYLQVDRGSYDAELGDRTYGVFNVNPKSGFERNREAELVATAGSALATDEQLSFADHSLRGAYYVSANGSRSDYGLSPPTEQAFHDAENGYGGLGSFTFNRDAKNQFRLLTQGRTDFFQIPYDPDPESYRNQLYDSSGLRDVQRETDGVVAFTWAHSLSVGLVSQISPFYHLNSANYEPSPMDRPAATTSERTSTYAGVQASVAADVVRNHLEGGVYGWGQHDNELFAARFNDGSAADFKERDRANGGLVEEYVSDSYKPTTFLTLTAGLRESYFAGSGLAETATSPRVGVALRVPKLRWVFRAFYGHFYQPPPLLTVAGPVLGYAQSSNTSIATLHGERDEEHQFGVQIPFKGWLLDLDTFQTEAANFLDHTNLGESSVYLPVTLAGALVRAWELTLESPRRWRYGGVYVTYANQIAQQRGAITGGLVCFPDRSAACEVAPGYSPLDHDQRNTLHAGGHAQLPWRMRMSTDVYYGSGFANGYQDAPSPYPGASLPQHTTFDLQVSRAFGEALTVSVNGMNVANRRVLLDNSLTFGGFHENDPRQVYGEVRYRFRY